MQPIVSGKLLALPGTAHPLAKAQFDQGSVDSSMRMPAMTVEFGLTVSQQAALTALLKAQQDPSSASYHHWLTTAQYAEEFGMTQADIDKATAWLRSQGLTVVKVADSRNQIWFNGTASQVEAAFHTQIHKYTVNGETHFANSSAVSVPSALASTVVRIGGLDNFGPRPGLVKAKHLSSGARPDFTSGSNAPDAGSHYIAPTDFAIIYDLNSLYSAGFTGSGQTIGIMGQTDIVQADIDDFRTNSQLPAYNTAGGPSFSTFLIPGAIDPGVQDLSGDINEADLDIEWSGGVAKNANIVFVISSANEIFNSLQYAIGNAINGVQIPILSISYAGCEAAQPTSFITSLESLLQQANAQGQTVLNSAGDTGAAACDASSAVVTSATQGLSVNYPASSAYVTGLGGSEFMGDGTATDPSTGADQYWSGTGANDLLTSALSYIPEMAWNDTTYAIQLGGGLSAGGGGASILFPKPTWQSGVAGIPNDGARDVPDVSLNASADHDGYLVCTQVELASDSNPYPTNADFTSSCIDGFRISDPTYVGPPEYDDDGYPTIYGGTSVSTPTFAGILALIEQKLGTPLGNINPALYSLASNATTYASAFNDIKTGNNEVPCTSGSPDCPSSGVFGFAAGVGYDQATGLGSVDGNNLASAFASVAVKAGSTTGVSVSPASPVVGEGITLTATITPNTGTTAPTGTVSFSVDGIAVGTGTVADGTATYSPYNFSTGGTHTITAAYSGDANYYASTTNSTITVGSAPTASPTTTTLVANPTSIALYSSITLTATVTSTTAGTVGGTVTFTSGGTTIGTATIVPGASGTGTAALSVSSATPALGFTSPTTSITAAYGGDSYYAASNGSTSVAVTNPGITMSIPNMTISSASPGNGATSTITLNSTGGYSGTVNLTAMASSLNAEYGFGSSGTETISLALASGGTASTTISIETVAADLRKGVVGNLRKASQSAPGNSKVIAGAAAAFGCVFLLGIPGFRKRRWPALIALLLLGGLGAGIGCGGGSSGASPSGTYTVTVTATDSVTSAITTSTNFTVTIQ
jgi:hypothetical protein